MTIDEAVNRLIELKSELKEDKRLEKAEAVLLGIEGLKAIRADRCGDASLLNRDLPGETEK